MDTRAVCKSEISGSVASTTSLSTPDANSVQLGLKVIELYSFSAPSTKAAMATVADSMPTNSKIPEPEPLELVQVNLIGPRGEKLIIDTIPN
jgi:hypothetical protein